MSTAHSAPAERSGQAAPVSRADEYTVTLAASRAEIRAAQRLRYEVFHEEVGAELHTPVPGADVDEFDERCDHLIVRHVPTDSVVGTYRLLPPGRAGRLYSDGEFELGALDGVRDSLVEAGRSCVHPAHRDGAVITLMWAAVGRYVMLAGHRYLAGCASVPLADGGHSASGTWRLARAKHLAPQEFRVHPHLPWDPPMAEETGKPSYAHVPALLRGYLRLGAWVCGPPAHDPDFGVADFFVLLPLDRVGERYLRYFLGDAR
ncbi:MAG: GNAT family N-acetyltransferase [Pseudonocardiaceae bacterium]|nr:GNAT family N-acetyltransferase [Pseudonocardiaceae bacterium]